VLFAVCLWEFKKIVNPVSNAAPGQGQSSALEKLVLGHDGRPHDSTSHRLSSSKGSLQPRSSSLSRSSSSSLTTLRIPGSPHSRPASPDSDSKNPPPTSKSRDWSPKRAMRRLKRPRRPEVVAITPSLAKSSRGSYRRGESDSESGSGSGSWYSEENGEVPYESSESEPEGEERARSGRDRSRVRQRDLESGEGRARSSRTGMLRD
jgi:hypothetical protein